MGFFDKILGNNTTKNDIDNFVTTNQNAVLVAFNDGENIMSSNFKGASGDESEKLTDRVVVALSCGEYTTNFDGTSSSQQEELPDLDIKIKNGTNGGTYITFYFLNNFDANMNIISSAGKFNAPSKGVSIYPTIIRNINK